MIRNHPPFLLLIALLVLGVVYPASAAESPSAAVNDLKSSYSAPDTNLVPPPGSTRLPVRVGLYVLNLVYLDEVHHTFICTGYLTEQWNDPRLSFTPKPGESAVRYYQKTNVWFPLVQFDNSTEPRTVAAFTLAGSADGTLRYTEKFSVKLSSNLYLRSFPFDSQELEVYVHPFDEQVRQVIVTADPETTGASHASYTPLPLWTTGPVTFRAVAGEMGEGDRAPSHVVFGIHVKRHSEYYVFRIFLPLFLMVAISWGVLFVPPSDLNSQLLISVTTVLTLVAFSVAVSNVLPPVPYLTFYDSFFLVSFFFIMLTIGEAILVHLMHGRNRTQALRVRRLTRRFLPPAFVFTASLMAIIFLH